jgi:hypothetical protein
VRIINARRGDGRYHGYECVADVACQSSLEMSVLEALERFMRYASDREQRDLHEHLNRAGAELRHREHMRSGYRDYYVDPFSGRKWSDDFGGGGGGGGMPHEGSTHGSNGRGNVDEEWPREQAQARARRPYGPDIAAEAARQAKEEANRRFLEELERIFGKGFAQAAANAAGHVRPPRPIQTPDWAVELGVPFPTSRDAIDKAYRALAKKRHPDVGGSQEAMTKLNLAYQKACQAYP